MHRKQLTQPLFYIRADDLCQVEYGHLGFAAEKRFQLAVCIDHAPVITVL